jgi:hypothetical protein
MTANDIMAGDLVLLNSKVTRITPTLLELISDLDQYDRNGLINGLDSIDLSPEFFEKNGFIQENKNAWRIPGLKENFRLFQWGNGSWSIEDHVLIEVRAVHELQHLFKMIGLKIELIV